MNNNQMMESKPKYETALTKISNMFFPMVQEQLENNDIEMNQYQKQCVMNTITAINNVLDQKGITWQDQQLDKSNITETLLTIASLQLNPAANPREVYFQMRNKKIKVNGKEEWRKQIEMGIEGDGNDAILSRFGRNVKKVAKFWEVRENDTFKYPRYVGLEMQSPEWQPTGQGKVVRVVYPIITKDDMVEYHISERHDVIKNLIAHISNNLMNETFGIAKDRYSATPDQKNKINAKKQELLDIAKQKGLDAALDAEELQKYISPAWKDPQSRESMIVRKMRNNIVKKVPKDFGNTAVEMAYEEQESSNTQERVRKEINEHANSQFLDMDSDGDSDSNSESNVNITNDNKEPAHEAQSESMNENTSQEEKQQKQVANKQKKQQQEVFNLDDIDDSDVPF